MLLRAKRANLDLDYLVRSATSLSLGAGLAQVLQEAFPGDPIPTGCVDG